MNHKFASTLACLGAMVPLLGSFPAIAHHSASGFNADEVKEISGIVREFRFTNPHTWTQVVVTDAPGREEEWSIEWGSPNALARRGVRPSTFAQGTLVRMRINPMVNGSLAGGSVGAKLADDTIVGDWERSLVPHRRFVSPCLQLLQCHP